MISISKSIAIRTVFALVALLGNSGGQQTVENPFVADSHGKFSLTLDSDTVSQPNLRSDHSLIFEWVESAGSEGDGGHGLAATLSEFSASPPGAVNGIAAVSFPAYKRRFFRGRTSGLAPPIV